MSYAVMTWSHASVRQDGDVLRRIVETVVSRVLLLLKD